MRIKALRVENFKRVTKIEIDTDRALVVLGGGNAAGKTSALDAITVALAGGRAIPADPIKRGEDRSEIELDLGDVVVKRTITRKKDGGLGGALTIRTSDGMSPRGAQSWLDQRLGNLSCDPVAFIRMDAKKQSERMREISGVDTTQIDGRRRALYSDRTELGRDGKRAAGALESMPHHPDAPAEEVAAEVVAAPTPVVPELVSVSAIAADLATAVETETAFANAERDASIATTALLDAKQEVTAATAALKAAQIAQGQAEARQGKCIAAVSACTVIDPEPIRSRLADAEATNAKNVAEADAANATARANTDAANAKARTEAEAVNAKVRANAARQVRADDVAALRAQYALKTDAIDALDTQRAKLLSDATFPIDGLGFDENGGVTYQGFPLEQASGAAKIRVSMAVALSGDPEIRVVLIRDASLLDQDSIELVAELAKEAGAQVWLERVGDADDGAVVIVDGEVV